MQTLFDVKQRTLQGPATYSSDTYSYYNDSARSDIDNVRRELESWFSLYPEDEKEELKLRFKVTFNPAFYELYIFVLFTKLGYSLEIHPDIPGTLKHPDYLARKDKDFFYIEVKHMTMFSHDEQSLERKKNVLLDAMNKVDASNFLLKLQEITFKDNSQPSGKEIIRHFDKMLLAHDPDDYTESLMKNGFDGMPNIEYEDDKVKIAVQLFPKSPAHRGTISGSIGSHPTVTQIGNDSEDIISALESKATRYGKFNAPYIICLNKQSVALDKIEFQESLYGSLKVSWSEDPDNRSQRTGFAGNGFFGAKHNPKFTRVSGVYITNANPGNLAATADHAFRHNPFASYPIDLTITQTLKEILCIPGNYPF